MRTGLGTIIGWLVWAGVAHGATTIDPGDWPGAWHLSAPGERGTWHDGPQTLPLETGRYELSFGGWAALQFEVTEGGAVEVDPGDAIKAEAEGADLTLRTVPVTLDASAFDGEFSFDHAGRWWRGVETLHLVPASFYRLRAGPWTSFFLWVEEDGAAAVRIPMGEGDPAVRARVEGSRVTFRTTPVQILPGGHAGSWDLDRGIGPHQGDRTLRLVPDGTYRLVLGSHNEVLFRVDDEGAVSVPDEDDRAFGVGSDLMLLTETVQVDPSEALAWQVDPLVPAQVGPGRIELVAGEYVLQSEEAEAAFTVPRACAGPLEPVTLGEATLTLSCPEEREGTTDHE